MAVILPVLALLLLGAAVGYLATRLMRVELGLFATVALGVAGALLGGLVVRVLASFAGSLIGAILGACLLIWLVERYGRRRR